MTLASTYLAFRPEAAADVDLDDRLRTLCNCARLAYPELALDDTVFVEYVAMRVPLEVATAHVADLYLACAVFVDVPGAADELERACISQIPRAISKIEKSSMFAREIQQRVREKLVVGKYGSGPRIAEYTARGSLAAFVRVAAIREALMEKRSLQRRRTDELVDEPVCAVDGDPQLEIMRRKYQPEFHAALRSAIARLDRRERAALRMSFIDNLSIDQIGRLFGVHRATAARWILRAQEQVRTLTRHAMQTRLQLTDSEADSLVKDLLSNAALSSGMLGSSISLSSMPSRAPRAA